MDSSELNETFCRICLEQDVILHWNDEIVENSGTTYKDCYYKYTQLEMPAVDLFSEMLCQTCSIDLRNTHILMEKALESHTVLLQTCTVETQISAEEHADDCEETEAANESVTEIVNKPSLKQPNFEVVILDQPNKETLTDDDNQEDKTIESNKCHVIQNDISSGKKQGKRVCKRPTWLENGTFEVNAPKSNIRASTSSSSKEMSEKLKKQLANIAKYKSLNGKYKKIKPNQEKPKEQIMTELDADYSPTETPKKVKLNQEKPQKQIMSEPDADYSPTEAPKKRKRRASRTYMCAICSLICKSSNELLRHENKHKGIEERSETCHKCGLKFFDKSTLELHVKTHDLNRERQQCEYCEKSYYNVAALNIHRRKHLGQMIPCPLCPKEYFRQVDLDRHNIVAHSTASLNKDVKKFPKYMVYCKECNKYMRTNSWRAHQANHLKEPLMKCSICDKDFFRRSTCTYHMDKTHDFKRREEYEPFIIYLKGRLNHLMLKQQGELKVIT